MGDLKSGLKKIKNLLMNSTPKGNSRPSIAESNHKQPIRHQVEVGGVPEIPQSIRASEKNSFNFPRASGCDISQKTRNDLRAKCGSTQVPAQTPPKPDVVKPAGVPDRFGEVRGTSLTRQEFFKKPDLWVLEGSRLQYSAAPNGGAVEIVIGLDFGTSYTKAAVGLKDQIFPVSWEGISLFPDPYLLPSEYSELSDGECHIGQAPSSELDHLQQRLKHAFIDPAVSSASIARAAVFVGLVLRYIRAWVYKVHGTKIGNSRVRWLLNIGSPSNGLEVGRLEEAYRKLGSWAWLCSQSSGRLDVASANSAAGSHCANSLPEGLIDLSVLPEFFGQIAGYVKSAQRKSGLHALVDIGGGTLDVVTFIVHESDGEDLFPFLVPVVRPLGTQMLNLNRFVGEQLNGIGDVDELQPVLGASEFASSSGLTLEHVELRDRVFWKEIERVVHHVLSITRQRRDPNSEHWRLGLPIFLTGGGANVEGYVNATQLAGARVAKSLQVMSLPRHPALAGFSGTANDYQRISVACGLAMDAMNLGQIRPARDVADLVVDRQPSVPRPDHEDIYG